MNVFLCYQGSEGVPIAYSPASAIHHHQRCAEDAGSHSAYCQLVSVCMDSWRPSESRPECSVADHIYHLKRARFQSVRSGPVGLHDGCG